MVSAQGKKSSPARLIVADDHALIRKGIEGMLQSEPDLEIVGEATDGREALDLCHRLRPDLVLMDVCMPRMRRARGDPGDQGKRSQPPAS